MIAYMVTCGKYSDYRLKGAFSTEEKAEVYGEKLRSYGEDSVRIDQWQLDESENDWVAITVYMLPNGEVQSSMCLMNSPIGFREYHYFHKGETLCWTVQTNNLERAIKVVNEKRTQILANNEWGNEEATRLRFSGT